MQGERQPAWQGGNKYAKGCRGRTADDVSAVAEGVAAYDSYGQNGWFTMSGTSIGAPFCAGEFALAGNAASQHGGRTFWVPSSHHAHLFEEGSPNGVGAF